MLRDGKTGHNYRGHRPVRTPEAFSAPGQVRVVKAHRPQALFSSPRRPHFTLAASIDAIAAFQTGRGLPDCRIVASGAGLAARGQILPVNGLAGLITLGQGYRSGRSVAAASGRGRFDSCGRQEHTVNQTVPYHHPERRSPWTPSRGGLPTWPQPAVRRNRPTRSSWWTSSPPPEAAARR
jgi:hypothetical protein